MKKPLFFGIIFFCVGCDNRPAELQSLEEALTKVKSEVASQLIDPYSARFEDLEFHYGIGGYTICGTVNAKNRFGSYTGANAFYGSVSHSEVIAIVATDDSSTELVNDFCAAYKLQSLPKLSQ